MIHNPNSVNSKSYRKSESSNYQRQNSSGSGHHKSDSVQSFELDNNQHERRHYKSRSPASEQFEKQQNSASQLTSHASFNNDVIYARPTSLFAIKPGDGSPDSLQPEREPIRFDVNLIGAPPEVEQLINNIKQVAEKFLYHWKTFPIVLPSPIFQKDLLPPTFISTEGSLGRYKQKNHLRELYLRDLFVAPSFDELDSVAVDCKGEPRKLTGKQLEAIRERGY